MEVRLSGANFSDRLNRTVGVFDYHAHERDIADVFAAVYNYFTTHNDTASDEAYAAYLHSEFKITDDLTVIGGLRESRESKHFLFRNADIPGTPSNSFPGGLYQPTSTDFNHMDYRFGLQEQFTPTFMLYADISTGFRSGGFNPQPSNPSQVVPYGPEKLTEFELGARNEFFDHRVRFNNTIYSGNYDDVQLSARTVGTNGYPANIVTNAGKAKIYGFESELQADVNKYLSFNGSGSFTHFRYTDLGAAAFVANGPTLQTDQAHTPKWRFQTGAQLNLPYFESYGKMTFNSDFSYQSRQYDDAANTYDLMIPAYGVLNARLTFLTLRNWQVSAAAMNLADRFYWSSKSYPTGMLQWKGVPSRPREWSLSVRKNF